MVEEADFENRRISNSFDSLVILTISWVIWHVLPIPIYQTSFESKKLFVDGRKDADWLIRLTLLRNLTENQCLNIDS